MIVMSGICSQCTDGTEKRLAKRNPPLCGYHYKIAQQKKSFEKNKDKPKKVHKPLKRTPLTYKREPTGELPMFLEIWSERPHESFINGEPIHNFDVSCMAHVLGKAQNRFPKFKLYKPCVVIVTRAQHDAWDFGSREDLKKLPEWDKMFELEEKLKQEYKKLYGK
jgi:hypothetical protein